MKRQFNMRVSEECAEQFKKIAKQRDIKHSQLFKEMLQAYLREKDRKDEK